MAYAKEYLWSLWHWFRLARRVRRERGFDVIHGCNPPDLVFLLALRYRLAGVRYLFDHHDVCPELFEAKFARKGLLYRIMLIWERMTFACASVSIATNESFREIAIRRGRMAPEDVFVVRSAPKIEKFQIGPADPAMRKGAGIVLGYVGVIGQQEGMDLLVAAADHLIRRMGRPDVHFIIVGFGPELPNVEADVGAARTRRILHLHRRALRRGHASRAQQLRYRGEPGPQERDERHLNHEQGHGIHDAGKAGGAVRPEGGPGIGRRGVALRPARTIRRISPRRSPS